MKICPTIYKRRTYYRKAKYHKRGPNNEYLPDYSYLSMSRKEGKDKDEQEYSPKKKSGSRLSGRTPEGSKERLASCIVLRLRGGTQSTRLLATC